MTPYEKMLLERGLLSPHGTPRIGPSSLDALDLRRRQFGDRATQASAHMVGRGWTPQQAAGIVGNLKYESGGKLNPGVLNKAGGGKGAFGIGQWRGPRQAGLKQFAGTEHPGMFEQLDYVDAEMRGTAPVRDTGAAATGRAFMANPNMSMPEAADTFMRKFERPSPAHFDSIDRREGHGSDVLKALFGPAQAQAPPLPNPKPQPGPEFSRPMSSGDFFAERGKGLEADGLNPVFSARLQTAIADAEKATGEQAIFTDLYRPPARQAQYRANYIQKPVEWDGKTYYPQRKGGLAAPPGKSRHQEGNAADLAEGPVLKWLHKNAPNYGLEFLKGKAFQNDSGHVQLNQDWKGKLQVGTSQPTPPLAPGDKQPGLSAPLVPPGGPRSPLMQRMAPTPPLDIHAPQPGLSSPPVPKPAPKFSIAKGIGGILSALGSMGDAGGAAAEAAAQANAEAERKRKEWAANNGFYSPATFF